MRDGLAWLRLLKTRIALFSLARIKGQPGLAQSPPSA